MDNTKEYKSDTSVLERDMRASTREVLDRIYKNARMGSTSLIDIMSKVKDDRLRSDLTVQLTGYEDYASKAASLLEADGVTPEEENIMTKAGAKMGMAVNTMMDSTSSHIAEMVIKGSNMGITDLTKLINRYGESDCSPEALRLVDEMIRFEKHNLTKMKAYL